MEDAMVSTALGTNDVDPVVNTDVQPQPGPDSVMAEGVRDMSIDELKEDQAMSNTVEEADDDVNDENESMKDAEDSRQEKVTSRKPANLKENLEVEDDMEADEKFFDVSCLQKFIKMFAKHGFAHTHLLDLVSSVYPSYKLGFLSSLIRKHKRNRRPLKEGRNGKPRGLQVMYFKSIQKSLVTTESIVKFFSMCFTHGDPTVKKNFEVMVKALVNLLHTHIMVVVVDSVIAEQFHIIACTIWSHEVTEGSFVPLIGVLDQGDSKSVKLCHAHFFSNKTHGYSHLMPVGETIGSFQSQDLGKFLLSSIQIISALGPRGGKDDQSEIQLWPVSKKYKRHHLYLQTRLEESNHAYFVYVQYGFEQYDVTRSSFCCNDYLNEIPIGRGMKKEKTRKEYGTGYYNNDCSLRRLCLENYLMVTLPPQKTPNDPVGSSINNYSSCLIPIGEEMDLYRETTDVFLHLKHQSKLYTNSPKSIHQEIIQDKIVLEVDPFESLRNNQEEEGAWKPILTVADYNREDALMSLKKDGRSELLPGCQLKHNTSRDLLLELAHVLYQCKYKTWESYPDSGSLQPTEATIPAEEFALELRWNLVGFYLRLSHCFHWDDLVSHFAQIIAREYSMRVSLGDDKMYNLEDNESIDCTPESIETGLNWRPTFRMLARRHIVGKAPTLWCDLFALTMLFNPPPLTTQLLIVPCYFEISAGGQESGDTEGILRFTVVTPQAMGPLEPTLTKVADRLADPSSATPFIVFPVLMYDHNPHMLMTEESVYPLYFKKTQEDYLESLDADLKQEDSMVSDHSLENPRTDWSTTLQLFDNNEVSRENRNREAYRKKLKDGGRNEEDEINEDDLKKKEAALKKAEEDKKKQESLKKEEDDKKKQKEKDEKEREEEELYQANKHKQWTKKPKKLYKKKVTQEVNDYWIEGDSHLDEKNPKYMYVDPEPPWRDRYLEHEEPPPNKWWNEAREGLGENFRPDEDHVFDQDDMDIFAGYATKKEKTALNWKAILQAARSMKTNVSLMPHELDHPYSDQDFVDLACLLDPGRGVQCDTLQPKNHTKIVLIVESYQIRGTLQEYSANKKIPKRIHDQSFEVYRNWLKKYLDFYNPGFYEFFDISVNGTKVNVIHDANAATYQGAYEAAGVDEYFLDVVPLPKSHPAAFLDSKFVKKYATASSQKDRSKRKRFLPEYEKECNPNTKFEFVPFPKFISDEDKKGTDSRGHTPEDQKIPAKNVQITAVKADLVRNTTTKKEKPLTAENCTVRWVALQDGKFCGVPLEWVTHNVSDDVMEEAIRRGLLKLQGQRHGCVNRFVTLPPGDTREDPPPEKLWNTELGLSFYYQEMIDNCLMGGFANAICSLCGPDAAASLLQGWNPVGHKVDKRWHAFIQKVVKSLSPTLGRVEMQRLKGVFTVDTDDSMPIVLQLKGKDGSETHAVTVYMGNIYDSASKYVLKKTNETLNWCCGPFGYDKTLRCYILVVSNDSISSTKAGKKKPRVRIRK